MLECYILFLLFSMFFFMGLRVVFYSKEYRNKPKKRIELLEITVLIPFRNEEENLNLLLKSFSEQETFPFQILFIDDHSEDDSYAIVERFKNQFKNVELLSLTEYFGKKAALLKGVEHAKTEYVLTVDADVQFNKEYYQKLSNLPENDLISLPVLMEGKSTLGKFLSVEHLFFNAFNYLLSPLYPISASGANLLYRKNALNYSSQLREHKHLSSGDDYFLLKALRKQKGSIQVSNDCDLSVKTPAPETFSAYFQQRLRWLSKTKFKMTFGEFLIGASTMFYFLGGFIALLLSAFLFDFKLFFLIFFLRLIVDSFIFMTYAQKLKRTKDLLFLPLFQVIYPPLMILVYLLSFYSKPKWKGRQV